MFQFKDKICGRWAAVAAASLVSLGACEDSTGVKPESVKPPPKTQVAFACVVSVVESKMNCEAASPRLDAGRSGGIRPNRIIGGQDVYVKLTSSGTSYDAGSQILRSEVTVQNLAQSLMGTEDGVTVDGVSVFFVSEPVVSSGTGTVTVDNADGRDVFTASNQPYFRYAEILEPYQISASREWRFLAPPTVNTFEFTVYVSVPFVDEDIGLVDAVWNGMVSGAWLGGGNWRNGDSPADTSVVAIPRLSLLDGSAQQPQLEEDEIVAGLRVGEGSVLTLNGYSIEVTRNVDAPGSIVGGVVRLSGTKTLMGGNLPDVVVSGGVRVQRETVVNGALTVTGDLTVDEKGLFVVLP